MIRSVAWVPLLVFLVSATANGKEWARKMFATTSHDFGTVARGANAEFEFEFENIYQEDIHVASVRTSCGCATPTITKQTLKTWEKGSILAVFNTRSFLGQRSATITVTIDKPYFAEVQLNVTGYVRRDVVIQPGIVDFGQVDVGESSERKIRVDYAGRDDWKLVDVRSANSNFEVDMAERTRGGGRVGYDLTVRLKKSAPAGYINDQLLLVTNDGQRTQIPLPARGRVMPPVTVSPAALAIGIVEPGQTVTKQLVVRSKKPFKITAVNCDDDCVTFSVPDESKALHLIPVTFTAASTPGTVSMRIQVETDLVPGISGTCVATATVRPARAAG